MKRYRPHGESTADLKELMTALPMTIEIHAEIMRKKVESRWMIEDAREAARQRQDSFAAEMAHG